MPLDLSGVADLRWLSALVDDVRDAAPDTPFILAGAAARDVILKHAHRIDTGRATLDVDMAFALPDWAAYEDLRSALVASGRFVEDLRQHQRVRHRGIGQSNVDLIPFAGIEDDARQIAWPPDGATVMNMLGFREAAATAVQVTLPGGGIVPVASLAAQVLLKLAAWRDRRLAQPGKDAQDIRLLMRNYLDAGNQERLFEEATHLLDADDFDYETAGAWLLGRDARRVAVKEGAPAGSYEEFARIVNAEVGAGAESLLVGDMRSLAPGADLALLRSFFEGFTG